MMLFAIRLLHIIDMIYATIIILIINSSALLKRLNIFFSFKMWLFYDKKFNIMSTNVVYSFRPF